MAFADVGDGRQIERIAQRMGEHDRSGLVRDRRGQSIHVHIKGLKIDIHEHRNAAVLHDRRDGCRETGGDGQHFGARRDALVAQFVRGQGGEGEEVRRRPGHCKPRLGETEMFRQIALELFCVTACGQPKIE